MKTLLFLLLLSSQSCITAMSWSPVHWVQNLFASKQYQAAQAYIAQDYDQALTDFHELMNTDPYNPEYNYNVGNVLYKQQKYNDAKQSFTRAIDHARKSSKLVEQAYFNTGNCCYQLEQWQDAVDAYEQVLQIDEDNQSAQHNLQLALYKLKEQQMKDQQQDQQQDKKSQEKNKEKSDQNKDQCQNSQSDGDDEDQGDQGQSQQDKGQQQKKSGSQKNNQGQEKSDVDGDEENQDGQSQEKSEQKNGQSDKQQSGQEKGFDQQGVDESDGAEESGEDQLDMNESDQQGDEGKKSSKNKLQDSGHEKEKSDDVMQNFDQTQGAKEDLQKFGQEDKNQAIDDDNKKEAAAAARKKPELKNELQNQYESKASDDNRLTDYHASVMKSLEDLEEKVQKHIIKNKVAQGSGQNGKKGW